MSSLRLTEAGLWCDAGGFFVDPDRRADLAVVTHAHGDHVHPLHREIVCSTATALLAQQRTRKSTRFVALPWATPHRLGAVTLTLHPSGHMLGSAMVRIVTATETVLVTGDLKRGADPTSQACEVPTCDTLVCEATFADPRFVWPDPGQIATQIAAWVRECARKRRAAVLLCYALGKSQRVLALTAGLLDQPPFAHRSIRNWNRHYGELGVALPETEPIPSSGSPKVFRGRLCLVPPQALSRSLRGKFGAAEVAFASGWAQDAGRLAGVGAERGFCLSDHADWNELRATIVESGARKVRFVHGNAAALVDELVQRGVDAAAL